MYWLVKVGDSYIAAASRPGNDFGAIAVNKDQAHRWKQEHNARECAKLLCKLYGHKMFTLEPVN